MVGAAAGTASGGTGGVTKTPSATTSGNPSTTPSTATVSVATGSANAGSSHTTSGTTSNNTSATSASVDPFADPLADLFGGKTKKRLAGGGGGSANNSGGSGGGGASGGSAAPNPSAAGPTPAAAKSDSSGNDLFQAVSSLGIGKTATSTTPLKSTAAPAQLDPWLRPSAAALPQVFEPNVGQAATGVAFVANGFGSSISLKPQEMDLTVRASASPSSSTALSLQLVGANATAPAVAGPLLNSRSNYFGGPAAHWHANVANYSSAKFSGIFQGIDVTYYANSAHQLEYDFTVAAGANPAQLRFRVQGADSVSLDSQGNLLLHTAAGNVIQSAPSSYQTTSTGRTNVTGHYVLNADGTISFAAGTYDTTKPLIIDPVLSYGTIISTNGTAYSVAADGLGNAYVAGTATTGYSYNEAFVTKVSPTGSAIFTSYLVTNNGAGGNVTGDSVAVDAAFNIYVAGRTDSSAFATTSGAYKTSMQGTSDDYVVKFNATGDAMLYSTLLDGSGNANNGGTTSPAAVAVDQYGHVYAAGGTKDQTTFPTSAGAFQTTWAAAASRPSSSS
jgi:hypothetical protein